MAHPLSEPTRFRDGKTKKCGQRGTRFGSDGPVAAEQRFRDALKALVAALGELPSPGMIIGGVAVIAAGVPRQTIDIDATVSGRTSELNVVLKALDKHGIVPRIEDAREFARHSQILLLVHVESSVTIELSFAWLPFEEEALEKALVVDIDGLPVRVARPEDLVIYKAAAWRDRDRSDIERLLVLHLHGIDLERVRSLVEQIGNALDDPDRLQEFDRIVARAAGSEG